MGIHTFQYQGEEALCLPARREAFTTLKAWLGTIAGELGLSDKLRKQLLIVADEIFTNIASYGYPSTEGDATVAVQFDDVRTELTLTFSDSGVPFNPLDTAEPDVTSPLAERTIGGLGMFMVKKLMDEVAYHREGERNILILKKRIT